MGKIVTGLQMSLDGVVEAPDKFVFPYNYANDEMMQTVGATMASSEAMLLGRVTYEGFAAYWPEQTGDIADYMNNTPKLVVSTTLKTAEWRNSTLISGDVADELRRRKQAASKDLNVVGSPTLVGWLLREGLLDELRLIVCPIVVGKGRRLFEDDTPIPLKLQEARTFSTGVQSLTYTPAGT
ncbi:MAG TPA: dihydrofolate reductase family protein [Actinomycetes bacterium]|jgi:dihydrofolate reductase|nr:dihydrofolate reductase family protein [Actinomycetes bacterium]